MSTQVQVQCLNRQNVILKYVIEHVEDSARDTLIILELCYNALSFVLILELIIEYTRDYGTISSTGI